MLEPRVARLQVLGNVGESQRWPFPCQPTLALLTLPPATPKRTGCWPIPLCLGCHPIGDHLPPPHLIPLPAGSSMWLSQFRPLCLCYLSVHYLPVLSVIHLPPCQSTLPLSTWLLNHLSCCPTGPPPSVCLPQTGS